MTFRIGCALALIVLAACAPREETASLSSTEPTASAPEAHAAIGTQPLPLRLAFMSGHVEAGLALFKAGAPEMAAKHLLHPVSESYAEERQGLDALGFDPALFEAVSAALASGQTAAEIAPQLAAAEAHLAEIAGRAGGDPREVITFLMATVVDEYGEGVASGAVVNAGEYQDAFGFTVVAQQRAAALPEPVRSDVLSALGALKALWPEAPIPPETPASLAQVTTATDAVLAAFE